MDRFKQWIKRAGEGIPVRAGLAILLVLVCLNMLFAQGPGQFSPASTAMFYVRSLAMRSMGVDSFQSQADVDTMGNLQVGQFLPERASIVRFGRSFTVQDTTSVVDLTGVPTTTASFTIWNGEPDQSRVLVIDRAFATVTTSAGAASAHTLYCMLNKGPVAAPSGNTLTVSSQTGNQYPGKAVFGRSVTVTNDGWFPCPDMGAAAGAASATTTIGLTADSRINGAIIVPPRHQFSLAMMGVNATEAARFGVAWHEAQIPVVY